MQRHDPVLDLDDSAMVSVDSPNAGLTNSLPNASLTNAVSNEEIIKEWLNKARQHRIKSIPSKIISDTVTIVSYLSTLYFANSVRRFVGIQQKILAALHAINYYVCTVPEEVLEGLSFEAATVGTEAIGITTSVFVSSFGIGSLLSAIQLAKFPLNYQAKKKFKALLKEKDIHIDSSIMFSSINDEGIQHLTSLINSLYSTDKNLLEAILKIYFSDLKYEKERNFIQLVKEHNLKSKILDNLPLKPSTWERFVLNTAWLQRQVAIYRKPLAALCAIPGFVYMIMEDKKIGGADPSTLITDDASVADQNNKMIEQVYPWMTASFPVVALQTTAYFFNFVTYVLSLERIRSGIYSFHKGIENWAEDEARWLYKNLGWEFVCIPLLPAIGEYSTIKSFHLADDYAQQANCGSAWRVIRSVYTDDHSDVALCSTASKANMISDLVADSEIDKAYLFYEFFDVLYSLIYYGVEKCYDLKRYLLEEKAKLLYEKFQKISDNNYYAIALAVFVIGAVQLFIARRFSNHIPEEGLTTGLSINDYISSNTSLSLNKFENVTFAQIADQICPYGDLGAMLNKTSSELISTYNASDPDSIFKIVAKVLEPASLINNSTLLITLASACPSYELLSLFINTQLKDDADCNPLVVYRTLAAFIALFWFGVAYGTYRTYNASHYIQLMKWGYESLKEKCLENSRLMVSEIDNDIEERKTPEPERINEELLPRDDSFIERFPKSDTITQLQNTQLQEGMREPFLTKTKTTSFARSVYNFFTCNKSKRSTPESQLETENRYGLP